MKRWSVRSTWLIRGRFWTGPISTGLWHLKPVLSSRPLSSTNRCFRPVPTYEYRPSDPFTRSIFRKVQRPTEIDEWTALLDGALPAHLRLSGGTSSVSLNAVDLAEVLLAAQYPGDSFFHSKGIDLLFHLGFNQGRWNAVVWLVKSLVEKFPIRQTKNDHISEVVKSWPGKAGLDEETRNPIRLDPSKESRRTAQPSLDDLVSGPLGASQRQALIQHNALGQIWRSLGNMTQACAGSDIRSEVLELLAYIHHHGFMPEAIYRYHAHPSKYVIQQPPLLPLLSSRILTSLSDAAWRAHEKAVIQEAKAKGNDDVTLAPELPGSVYRVNIAGLRPEVWMELILWSSLHGGWLFHGIAILRALFSDRSKSLWKPLSWREYENQLALPAESTSMDWEALDYIFKTEDVSTMLDRTGSPLAIEHTVSAEVVNAYIDALVNSVSVGVGNRGLLIEQIVSQLHQLRTFLGRSNLTISNGTWDTLIVRLVDHQGTMPEQNPAALQNMITLSSGIGQGLQSSNAKSLPAYALDGNMAIHGLLHRALNAQIMADNFEGAMAVFRTLQERTDKEKRQSLASFLANRSSSPLSDQANKQMFTSNFPGIDYPALDMGIPPVTLGRFLDQVINAKAYEFGRWLLYSQDVDGPVIGKRLYRDPAVQPAVLRFAAETDDKVLLGRFKGDAASMDTLRSLFDSQVRSGHWDAATRVLDHMRLLSDNTWSVANLANLSQAMMQSASGLHANHVGAVRGLHRPRTIFSDMVQGKYDGFRLRERQHSIQTLLWVLSIVDDDWTKYCARLQLLRGPIKFDLGTTAFNAALQGIADAHGSANAQRILETVWPQSARDILRSHGKFPDERGRMKMSGRRLNAIRGLERHRILLRLQDASGENADAVLMGALEALPSTIFIVFQKAFQEIRSGSNRRTGERAEATSEEIIAWTLHRFDEINLRDPAILQQIDHALSDQRLLYLKTQFPALIDRSRAHTLDNAEDTRGVEIHSARKLDNTSV